VKLHIYQRKEKKKEGGVLFARTGSKGEVAALPMAVKKAVPRFRKGGLGKREILFFPL